MKKDLILVLVILAVVIALGGCATRTITLIDWTDFVKWDGISYERGGSSDVIIPSELVGERVGIVAKNAPSEVSSPNYKPEDGMAAFLPVGTEFFEIEGYDSSKYIAVYTDGDYVLYKSHDSESISFNVSETDIGKIDDIKDLKPTAYETINNFDDVTMTVKGGTVLPTGLTLVFENDSSSQCIYGQFFILEKKINGKWYQIPVVIEGEYGFEDIGYELNSGDYREWEVDWNWLYGSLDKGEYRIVKDVLDFRETGDYDTYYLAAEFTIN